MTYIEENRTFTSYYALGLINDVLHHNSEKFYKEHHEFFKMVDNEYVYVDEYPDEDTILRALCEELDGLWTYDMDEDDHWTLTEYRIREDYPTKLINEVL
jgi:hypothetical protein